MAGTISDETTEAKVFRGALLEAGFTELADYATSLQFDGEPPTPWMDEELGFEWCADEYFTSDEADAIFKAAALAHRVHDHRARLRVDVAGLEVECPKCDEYLNNLGVGPSFPCEVCGALLGDDPNVGTLSPRHAACISA